LCGREDEQLTITVQGQEIAVVEEFVYFSSSPSISHHNAIIRVAMQNLDNQI